MKKVLAVVVLAGVFALTVTYFRMGAIAKNVIETHGPRMLGAPVEVGAVILSPFSGRARITGLRVGNPEGFKGDTAFRLNDVTVALDLKSLRGDGPILVHEILIDGPVIFLEAGTSGSNLQRIQKNLAAYSPSQDAGGKEEKAQAERKVKIGLFRLSGAQVQARLPQVGQDRTVALPLVELKNVGREKGITSSEAARLIVGELMDETLKATGGVKALLERGTKLLDGLFKKKR